MRVGCYLVLLAVVCLGEEPKTTKVLGDPAASATIEIFASFDCPHCRELHEQKLPYLINTYVKTGKMRIIQRDCPLPGPRHPYARLAANYATAAARIGRYGPVSDALFQNQAMWAVTGKVWETVASALTTSERPTVQALANDPAVLQEVEEDWQLGRLAGIHQTPTIFLTYKARKYAIGPEGIGTPLFDRFMSDLLSR
jgi:protein-disulfide isomerase